MKINSKDYKIHIVRTLFKSKKILLFGHSSFKTTATWLKFEQFLKINNCLSYRISNRLLKISLNNTIFHFLKNWINGPILIIELNDLEVLNKVIKKFKISAVKIDNKIYTSSHFHNINNLNYENSIKSLVGNLNHFTKNLSIKLNKIDKIKSE